MLNKSKMPAVNVSGLAAAPFPNAIQMSGDDDRSGASRSEQRQLARVMSELRDELNVTNNEIRQQVDKHGEKLDQLHMRSSDIEQKIAVRRGGGGGNETSMSWGETVVQSSGYKNFVSSSCKGSQRIPVANALTSVGTSGGALVRPDRRDDGVMLPRRRLTIRALLGSGETGSNLVEYFKEKTFVNNAAMVAETTEKPESEMTYELVEAPVRTIAHWVPASRQLMDDAAQLRTLVDSSLRYGLALKEEQQFLFGDGQGQNLHGMMPQATAFDIERVDTTDMLSYADTKYTRLDALRDAAGQAAEADLPSSGIILNTRDFWNLLGIKDGDGNYILPVDTSDIWGLPVVYTNAMPVGQFLVGAFETATQIFDRMQPEVLVSSEDRDNFIKNMLTIRGESRLAFAVKRPAALIKGDFEAILTAVRAK